MKQFCKKLLEEWCRSLLALQIQGTGDPKLDGAILCPACEKIHGRCFEAMYPFLYMAAETGEESWIKAAEQLFQWAEHTVSQPDGSFLNDIASDWKGTTVFNVIQLADCLLQYEEVISDNTKHIWKSRLKQAAEFLYFFEELNSNNINYPISNGLALYECGMVLGEPRFTEKAKILAALAEESLTDHQLLFGEGVPRFEISAGGCRPVDIGYNVEETLPSLALYGMLSGDKPALDTAEKGLMAHLAFMAENGAWDNSFGTRNFKWTYWGSRTSDGCGLGYLLLAHKHPVFARAAELNLKLLKECTSDGLLAGGPHYQAAGQKACVHHTFTHAKVVAGILDRGLCVEEVPDVLLPRQKGDGIHHYPEIGSWLINLSSMTATVTAYDWEYLPGGHVSGGTLSFWHHAGAGTLLCAGMGEYTLKEPGNMQTPVGVRHECLALRIEKRIGNKLYSSIYENCANVFVDGTGIRVSGALKDIYHESSEERIPYAISYEWGKQKLEVKAEFAQGVLICPLISRQSEKVTVHGEEGVIWMDKESFKVHLETSGKIKLPYGTERIFSLVPGLQALRVDLSGREGVLMFSIEIY